MTTKPALMLFLGLLPPLVPAAGAAQEIVRDIPDGPGTVVSAQRMVIGERDGPAYVDSPFYVAQTPRGGFLVTVFNRPGDLLVLDEDGELLNVVGRTGQGPGELLPLPMGRIVLSMDVQTPEHAGHPYHLVDRDGSFLRSFGGDGGVDRSSGGSPGSNPMSVG